MQHVQDVQGALQSSLAIYQRRPGAVLTMMVTGGCARSAEECAVIQIHVVTWGNSDHVGDSSAVQARPKDGR